MTKLWRKQKHGFKKKGQHLLKTQHFLYTKFSSIEDHNQTKQPFQTRILHKKEVFQTSKQVSLYISIQKSIKKFIQTIPYLDFFFFSSLLLLLLLLLFSSPLFTLSGLPYHPKTKMKYYFDLILNLELRPCLA